MAKIFLRHSQNVIQMITDYLKLCRVSNLPTVWTNVLAAVVLSGSDFSGYIAVPAFSMSLFYSGGMCMNDVLDSGLDRLRRPSRPIPSGLISPFRGAVFSAVLLLAGLLVLGFSPYPEALYSGSVLLALIIAYNLFHNMFTGSILLMAGCRFMIFAVTAAAVQGRAAKFVLMAGAIQFLYTIAISYMARLEKKHFSSLVFPIIPFMIAGFSLVDGLVLGFVAGPVWLLAGLSGACLTVLAQKFVRGD